ncbi:uncharacterized protein [Gossypium hirsutum]|uniref:Uncharacterized protein n=1 Tax=Gossypium hirsutum TaxID=3635 RepID=A0A1U8I4Z0_GOSHI|nr:uncharacterized protein LOC107892752 [Gossypium hirsutum]
MGRGQKALDRGARQAEARQPTLVYATRHRDDEDALNIITSTFFILDVLDIALIDMGSTHSYIASNISGNLGILIESNSSEVTVLSLLGQSVRVSKLYRDVPLEVQGTRIVLRTEEGNEVVVIRECQNYWANVISALVAEKLVRKGYEVYLAYVSVSASGNSIVKDIKTVRDFLDVFPEELSGLPLNWEVEFGIEIFPGTASVTITRYRMAPKEPEPGKEFTVYSDASHVDLGCMLMQDGKVVAYASR